MNLYNKLGFLSVLMFLTFACKSTQPIRQAEKILKGNWTLTKVSYSRPGTFNVKLYNDAGANCFEGSIWQFIPNNNTGTYQFTTDGCDTSVKNIKWTIPLQGAQQTYNFMMKPLTVKKKSIEGNKGFRTTLESLDGSQMVWSQKLEFEGKPFKITMNFVKSE